jgi:hypothetical protein
LQLALLLHFLKLDIQTASLQIREWIERLYVSNDLTSRFPDKSASLKLCVERKDALAATPVDLPANRVFAETNLCNARCFYQDGRFFSANSGDYWHELEYDLHAHTIRINVGGRYFDSGQFVITNIIRPLLQSFLLPFYGIKTLHGAVLSRGDRTFFLIGHGGIGKTTTALQLMRAGYDILSDDGPFFFADRGQAYVLSSLDYLHPTEATMSLFPELKEHQVGAKDHRGKFCVRMSDVQNSMAFANPRRISHCILLNRRQDFAVPRAVEIPRSIVHRHLVDECMVIFRRPTFRDNYKFQLYVEFVFDLLAKVVQGAEAFDLEFADQHLPDIPRVLDRL